MVWNLSGRDFRIVIGCFLCSFLVTFQSTSLLSMLDVISEDIGKDFIYAMWVNAAMYITIIGFTLFNIEIANKYGKRTTMLAGLVIFAVGCVITSVSFDLYTLILSKIFAGIGSSMILISCLSVIKDKVDDENINVTLATNFALNCLAGALGPFFGLGLSELIGWRGMTLAFIPLAAIAFILIWGCENIVYTPEKRIRYVPHVLYVVSVVMILNSLFIEDEYFWTFWVGLALFVVLCVYEYIAKEKFIDLGIFYNKVFFFSMVVGVLFYLITYAMCDLMTNYLQILGGEVVIFGTAVTLAVVASTLNALKPVVQLFSSPVIAKVFDHKGAAKITFYSLIFISAAPFIYVMTFLFVKDTMALIVMFALIFVILGLTAAAFSPHNKSLMMGSVDKEQRNTASAMVSILDNIGKIVGITILGAVEIIVIRSFLTFSCRF